MRNVDKLCDNCLKDKLEAFNGSELPNNVPEIAISLLPEMKPVEIRAGLSSHIMSFFKKDSEPITAEKLTDVGLERFKYDVAMSAHKKLVNSVDEQLKILSDKYLREYIRYNKKTKCYEKTKMGERVSLYFASRKAVTNRLKEWISETTPSTIPKEITQTKLDYFDIDVSDNE